jgi:hypothetical protein
MLCRGELRQGIERADLIFHKLGFTKENICGIMLLLPKFNITVWVFFYLGGLYPFLARTKQLFA